jgi:hypothetical protein
MGYWQIGQTITLDDETSRACGHAGDAEGETPTPRSCYVARLRVHRIVQSLANSLGKSIEVYASHPSAKPWCVDVVDPVLS